MWDEDWELEESAAYGRWDERVLVVVVPTLADWGRVCGEGWYRIPIARAPARIGAEFLAFYFPKAFGERRWRVTYYAPIKQYRIVTRRELLPTESDHPRADDLYFRFELGPLQTLDRPIMSQDLRRITFIMTTLSRLLAAREIRDLWMKDTRQRGLQRATQIGEEFLSSRARWARIRSYPSSYSARMPGT